MAVNVSINTYINIEYTLCTRCYILIWLIIVNKTKEVKNIMNLTL